MGWSMYRLERIPYDTVFDLPYSTCRYCGTEDHNNLAAIGWFVDEPLPHDARIKILKKEMSEACKTHFSAFVQDYLSKSKTQYQVQIPICRMCRDTCSPLLEVMKDRFHMAHSVSMLGRVFYVTNFLRIAKKK